MIDLKILRENPQLVQKAAKDKGVEIDAKEILKIEKDFREQELKLQKLREERNKVSKEKNIEKGRKLKTQVEEQESVVKFLKINLDASLFKIPNIPAKDVPVGKDETKNR